MMADFLCATSAEALERQIFDLMFTGQGNGLGMSYTEIMQLDVARKNRFIQMLYDDLERITKAMNSK